MTSLEKLQAKDKRVVAFHPGSVIGQTRTGVNRYSYSQVHFIENGVKKYQPLNRYLAELALGKNLPKGACVHHVDGNPLNNESSNLVICPSHAYHMLLHKRLRQALIVTG